MAMKDKEAFNMLASTAPYLLGIASEATTDGTVVLCGTNEEERITSFVGIVTNPTHAPIYLEAWKAAAEMIARASGARGVSVNKHMVSIERIESDDEPDHVTVVSSEVEEVIDFHLEEDGEPPLPRAEC